MFDTLLNNWNSRITKNDEVYVLGDFAWKNDDGLDFLNKANGKKFLIKGNHDKLNKDMENKFIWVKEYAVIKDNGNHIVLFHYPIAHWQNADYGNIHLYGHIHTGRDTRPFEDYVSLMKKRGFPYQCFNVGCMLPYMNYTPRTLEEIMSANN